jgi:hypothetical protein
MGTRRSLASRRRVCREPAVRGCGISGKKARVIIEGWRGRAEERTTMRSTTQRLWDYPWNACETCHRQNHGALEAGVRVEKDGNCIYAMRGLCTSGRPSATRCFKRGQPTSSSATPVILRGARRNLRVIISINATTLSMLATRRKITSSMNAPPLLRAGRGM